MPRQDAERTIAENGVVHCAVLLGWTPHLPHPSIQSGIQLFQAEDSATKALAPKLLRDHFLESGVALSSYHEGLVRVSLPKVKLTTEQVQHFANALAF